MSIRSSVNFSEKLAPLFKKYASTYGVKNICSLGVVLIDWLKPELREELMSMVGEDKDVAIVRARFDFEVHKLIADAIRLRDEHANAKKNKQCK